MSTPHNSAEKGQIAKTVLMPGDPLRARFIANTFLENAVEFNHVRGMLGFTGNYKGKPVSVMGSGMGMPSMGIYSYELFSHFDVDSIIRIGSSGGYSDSLKNFDVVIATEVFSDSTYALMQNGFTGNKLYPDLSLNQLLKDSAAKLGYPLIEGCVHCSDIFYYENTGGEPYWQKVLREENCICVDMESFALFHNANVTGKKAACILTISDMLTDHKVTTTEEREKSFTNMMEIALGAI